MTKRRADYCPYCGTALETAVFEDRDRRYCPDCGDIVFQNPFPGAHVVVLDTGGESPPDSAAKPQDGESVLLIERAIEPDLGAWAVPGGILEVDEPARVGAARELEEEAGLAVDPDALALVRTGFDVDDPDDGAYLSVCFAVERADTTGSIDPGPECADARWWPLTEVSATDAWIRPIDRRRIEAAVDRLRDRDARFD
ncbi:NUDIX hydrolase [Halosimplex carlsbadense 2-9-1]|uniref:NUDIX hydrolase n=1 Tax=Halosimplex carlsbadense 2-9-1 TaxID=797114 RepID=M0D2A6_9EURY|nr:NUDIX domain-containing protein [Halosimplex carlsbadense]ELZ28832.1 NUDIX hydrolase [Halosimplex carlsbadense 2-9-1]